MATWRELILEEMEKHADPWECVESIAGEDVLDVEFDDGFGPIEGEPFTIWTASRVYFPTSNDGAEYCRSVSRHPDGKPTEHI